MKHAAIPPYGEQPSAPRPSTEGSAPTSHLPAPLFLPVFQPGNAYVSSDAAGLSGFGARGCIVNGFFLYKNRESRDRLLAGVDIHDHIQFPGIIVTDSGAFQGFSRPLFLNNKTIVAFQRDIGVNVASPLDLVTPPGDNRDTAEGKMRATFKRVREGLEICGDRCLLAAVQQGGRFASLRRQATDDLLALGPRYMALGSLVPFFTAAHDLSFVGAVIRWARLAAGPELPIHVYGAGDPLELPFMAALGANVFDSSSYVHFARAEGYMTPFGTVKLTPEAPQAPDWAECGCPECANGGTEPIRMGETGRLARHNLWTILRVVEGIHDQIRAGTLAPHLDTLLVGHARHLPPSKLAESFDKLLREDPS